jgi:hypothetical protein
MRPRLKWHITPLARAIRGLWPDGNPLRRSSDRAEAGMLAVLIVAFLVGAPLIALIAWQLTFSATFTTVQAQHAGWRQVPAVLLDDAPGSGFSDPPVPATWTAPDGAVRTGVLYASAGARAGTTTPIWVNAAGQQVKQPLTPWQAKSQADVIAAIAGPLWGMLLLAAGLLGHSWIDARRMAGWDADLRAAHFSGPASASP